MEIKKFSFLIGIFLLIFILYNIDLENMVIILKSSDIIYLIFALFINILTTLTMALRWKIIVNASNIEINFISILNGYLKGALWATLTPGKLGELYRVLFLKEKGKTSMGIALSTIVIERIFDLFYLLIAGFIGILILSYIYTLDSYPILFILIVIVSICFILYSTTNKNIMKFLFKPIFTIFVPKKYKEKAEFHFDEFYIGLKSIKSNTYIVCLLFTFFIWFLNSFLLYILSLSLELNVSFWFIIIVLPITTLINLIPISISGIGLCQASFIFLFGLMNISPESAVALSFLSMFFNNFCYAFPGLILYSFQIKEKPFFH